MTELKTKIIETLSKGDIKMIPKWRLALYSFGAIFALAFLFLVLIFTLSLIFFILSRYGFMYLPMFGFMTILHTLKAVPLLLLLCTVVLLIVIELISRKYAFSFRRPLAITLLSITTLAVVISFLLSMTSVHEYVRDYAKEHDISLVSNAYKRPLPIMYGSKDMTVVRGSVIDSSTDFVVVELFDGTKVKAYASTTAGISQLPLVGSDILLFGNFVGEDFEIIGIKNAPREPFGRRKMIRDKAMRDVRVGPVPESEINMFRGR